jgi:uncharacterized protein (TIRG00374 family)
MERGPKRLRGGGWGVRLLAGIAVSAVFLYVTASGVDLQRVGELILRASPLLLVIVLGGVVAELAIRAFRWQRLLAGISAQPSYRRSFAFLCIGYFANTLLPARLGDLARAYLAARAFDAPRLATLGTIIVERLADGSMMLVVVLLLGSIVAAGGTFRETALALLAVGIAGVVVVAVVILAGRRARLHTTRVGRLVTDLVGRLMLGATSLRTPSGAAYAVGATVVAFALSVLVMATTAAAVGLDLAPEHAILVTAGTALSLAIPAAPGSVGTYEFVGLTILVSLGLPAELSLATIVLVHVFATLPPTIAGFVALWLYQVRVGTIVATAEPAEAIEGASG